MKIVNRDADALPFGLIASDLKYPTRPKSYRHRWGIPHKSDLIGTFTLHKTERFGWIIATLHIRNPGRRHRSDAQARTYGVDIVGRVVRVGLGPHITRTITVYISRGRQAALQNIIDLHRRGMADAGSIRDRISTRRALGAMRGWL